MALQADIHFYYILVYQYATVLMHNKIPDLIHWSHSEDLWKWQNKHLFINTKGRHSCRNQLSIDCRIQNWLLVLWFIPMLMEKAFWSGLKGLFSHKSSLQNLPPFFFSFSKKNNFPQPDVSLDYTIWGNFLCQKFVVVNRLAFFREEKLYCVMIWELQQ